MGRCISRGCLRSSRSLEWQRLGDWTGKPGRICKLLLPLLLLCGDVNKDTSAALLSAMPTCPPPCSGTADIRSLQQMVHKHRQSRQICF
jgi:hypothetical protein